MWWCDDVTQSNPNLHIIYTHVFPRFSETFDGFCRFFPFCTLNQTTFLLFQFEWHISLSLLLLFLFAVDVFFINGNNGLVWPMRMYMLWYLWSMVIAQFCPLHVHFKSIFNTISIARCPSTGCVIHFERHICVHLFASFSIWIQFRWISYLCVSSLV